MDLSQALDAVPTLDRKRVDRAAGRLVGSLCSACSAASWPARAICHRCGSAAVEEIALSTDATLITYTTVWVPRPGLEPPYVLGQVELPEGVRIFAHARELGPDARVPLAVHLVIAPEADAIPPFWFEPTESA